MPGGCTAPRPQADIILGDAHGTTCAPRLVRRIEELLGDQGFSVRRNDPYAGGYITRHYGRPREAVHAVQIEISRPLYMDETRMERSAGFAGVQARIAAVIAGLSAALPTLDPG
jgi:N-formylglutamate deformylase